MAESHTVWLAQRFKSITGTDTAKILGLDPYCTRKKLADSKIFEKDLLANCSPITENIVNLGNVYEETAQETFLTANPTLKGFKPSLHQSARYPFLCGSPDYLIPEQKIVVEFKTHFFPCLHDAMPLAILPPKHYLQVQTYLEILDWEDAILYSWTVMNGSSTWKIKRDRSLFEGSILEQLREFYKFFMPLKRLVMEDVRHVRDVQTQLKKYRQSGDEKTRNLKLVSASMDENVKRHDITTKEK